MIRFTVLQLFCIVNLVPTNCFKISLPQNGKANQLDKIRIIGGHAVDIENRNYQVSIKYYGSHICGGAIINKRTILSAAHCFEPFKNYDSIEIQAGSTYINSFKDQYSNNINSNLIKVNKIIKHPQYNIPVYLENDLAILILSTDLEFSKNIGLVNLPEPNDLIEPGTIVTVSGWGTMKTNSNRLSNELRSVDIVIIDFKTCNQKNFYQVNEINMICAGDPWGGKDSCSGDSGGPLVSTINDKNVLIGIVSWGFGCGNAAHPGVYTKISSFTNWIKMNSYKE